jgi:hypothetical protein
MGQPPKNDYVANLPESGVAWHLAKFLGEENVAPHDFSASLQKAYALHWLDRVSHSPKVQELTLKAFAADDANLIMGAGIKAGPDELQAIRDAMAEALTLKDLQPTFDANATPQRDRPGWLAKTKDLMRHLPDAKTREILEPMKADVDNMIATLGKGKALPISEVLAGLKTVKESDVNLDGRLDLNDLSIRADALAHKAGKKTVTIGAALAGVSDEMKAALKSLKDPHTAEGIDKNKDGWLSFSEFTASDLYKSLRPADVPHCVRENITPPGNSPKR